MITKHRGAPLNCDGRRHRGQPGKPFKLCVGPRALRGPGPGGGRPGHRGSRPGGQAPELILRPLRLVHSPLHQGIFLALHKKEENCKAISAQCPPSSEEVAPLGLYSLCSRIVQYHIEGNKIMPTCAAYFFQSGNQVQCYS